MYLWRRGIVKATVLIILDALRLIAVVILPFNSVLAIFSHVREKHYDVDDCLLVRRVTVSNYILRLARSWTAQVEVGS